MQDAQNGAHSRPREFGDRTCFLFHRPPELLGRLYHRYVAGDGRLSTRWGLFSILLVRKLRGLDLQGAPVRLEKHEQVCFFFLCQTKWLHEGLRFGLAPPPLSRNSMTSSKLKKTPSCYSLRFRGSAQGGCLERAFIPFLACRRHSDRGPLSGGLLGGPKIVEIGCLFIRSVGQSMQRALSLNSAIPLMAS